MPRRVRATPRAPRATLAARPLGEPRGLATDGLGVDGGEDPGREDEADDGGDQQQALEVAEQRVPQTAGGGAQVGGRDLLGAVERAEDERPGGAERDLGDGRRDAEREREAGERAAAVAGGRDGADEQEQREDREGDGDPAQLVGGLQRVLGERPIAEVDQRGVGVGRQPGRDVRREAAHRRQHHRARVGDVEHERVAVVEQQAVGLLRGRAHQRAERPRRDHRLHRGLQQRSRRDQIRRPALDDPDHDLPGDHVAHRAVLERRDRPVGEPIPVGDLRLEVQRDDRADGGDRRGNREHHRDSIPPGPLHGGNLSVHRVDRATSTRNGIDFVSAGGPSLRRV